MKIGLIDSASITSIIDCLHVSDLKQASFWAYRSAIESTVVLISNPYFGIVPSPERRKESVGDFSVIQSDLGLKPIRDFPSESAHEAATRESNLWLYKNSEQLRKNFWSIYSDADFQLWLNNEIDFIWAFHAESQGSLFNKSLIDKISGLIQVEDKNYITELHSLSGNQKELLSLIESKPDTEDFRTLCKAYAAAFFLRSAYHDFLAQHNGHTIFPHSLRLENGFLPQRKEPQISFEETISAARLAELIILSARKEPEKHRAKAFSDYITKTRKNYERIDLTPKSTKELGTEATVNAARIIGVHTRGRWFERAINASIILATGGITAFFLNPFVGFGVSAAISALSIGVNPGKKYGHVFDTKRRIRNMLSDFPNGRLNAKWEK